MCKPMTPSKIKPLPDKRGKHTPKHALDNSTLALIDEHIDSFNPSASHYRSIIFATRIDNQIYVQFVPGESSGSLFKKELRKTNSKEKYKLLQTQ